MTTTISYYQNKISVDLAPERVFALIKEIDSEDCTPDVIFAALEPHRCAETHNTRRLVIERVWSAFPY